MTNSTVVLQIVLKDKLSSLENEYSMQFVIKLEPAPVVPVIDAPPSISEIKQIRVEDI